MLRFVTIPLLLVYLVFSTGIQLHLHYCCGRLADMGLEKAQPDQCGKSCCGSSEGISKRCCEFEELTLKIGDPQSTPRIVSHSPHYFQVIPFENVLSACDNHIADSHHDPRANDPPGKVPGYILNCSFVFYG